MISDEAGEYLVKLAKDSIKCYLEKGRHIAKPDDYPSELDEKLGVFVVFVLICTNLTMCCTNLIQDAHF